MLTDALRPYRWTFCLSLLGLLLAETLRVYWIMPMPGSQGGGTLAWAYLLHRAIWPLRVVLGGPLLVSALRLLAGGTWRARVAVSLGLLVLGLVAWQANGPMSADVMFRQPQALRFAGRTDATLAPQALVVGISLPVAGSAAASRAYPIRFIGYHHHVRDRLAGQEVMVTYCTVCRTGRVFRPLVDGTVDDFRLVGMDQWNAMFEDRRSGSWWRQATGEAVAGPLTGRRLAEIESRQMTWEAWSALHPETTVMEPDPAFADRYERMEGFEEGTRSGGLTGRDPGSWNEKSWVVGVLVGDAARAFDWNELVEKRVLADRVGDLPVIVTLGADGNSFYAFDARQPGSVEILSLEVSESPGTFVEPATGARWSAEGLALDGPRAGARLAPLRAYQEFWHSWRTFRPETTARR